MVANVSESDAMNSHMPSFFEPMANGERPPAQASAPACDDGTRYLQIQNSIIRNSQSPVRKCQ